MGKPTFEGLASSARPPAAPPSPPSGRRLKIPGKMATSSSAGRTWLMPVKQGSIQPGSSPFNSRREGLEAALLLALGHIREHSTTPKTRV